MKLKHFVFVALATLWSAGSVQAQTVWNGSTDTQWYDDNPDNSNFSISTAEELAGLAELVNNGNSFAGKTINLTANILLNDTSNWQNWGTVNAGLNQWMPIGNQASYGERPFSGNFNGQGHTVSGLFIRMLYNYSTSSPAYAGLFGLVIGNVIFSNVGITASYTYGNQASYGANHAWGSLAGYLRQGSTGYITVSNCYNAGTVVGFSDWRYDAGTGGLFGNIGSVIMSNCHNTGLVSGTANVGGIAGSVDFYYGDITDCTNSGEISGGERTGGLFGNAHGPSDYEGNFSVKNCYNNGAVHGKNTIGGLIGSNSASVVDCYNTGTVTGTAAGSEQSYYIGGLFGSCSRTVVNCYNSGAVTCEDHTVGGLSGTQGSFINCYNTATVTAFDNVGGLVGENVTNLIASYNSGSVNGRKYVGGLVGYQQSEGKINNSYNLGAVTGNNDNIGGLVGYNRAYNHGLLIYNCYNRGNVAGADSQNGLLAGSNYVGGIIGYSSIDGTLTVHNSYNTGDVSGSDWIGGLSGYTESATIRNCYNAGSVTGYNKLGGLIGEKAGGSVTYSYWRNDGAGSLTVATGGGSTSTGCSGKTAAELKDDALVDLLNTRTRAMNNADVEKPYSYWTTDVDNANKGYVVFGAASVNFDKNSEDASEITPGYAVTSAGGTVELPANPSREGYVFAGWNTKADATGNAFTAETPVAGHITVYAFWKKIITVSYPYKISKTYDGNTDVKNGYSDYYSVENHEYNYYDVSAKTVSAVYSDKNVGENKIITVICTLEGNDAWRYVIYPATWNNGIITPLQLTHDIAMETSKTYDKTDAVIDGYTGGLTNSVADDDVQLVAEFKYDGADAGWHTIFATQWELSGADAGNYTLLEYQPISAYINQSPQSISFDPAISLKMEDGNYVLSATSTSELPVMFRLRPQDAEFAEINGDILTPLAEGEIEVTAYVESDNNYENAQEIPVRITITSNVNIHNTQKTEAKVYINNDELWITGYELHEYETVSIYDVFGRQIVSLKLAANPVNVSYLIKGVYFIKTGNTFNKVIKR
ncbi:MAG: YDG domain-containing protein [Dysgonamonadaceae bacterium]|jgi:uncharacterized repeat protein (TIGR02543 family)|nr:YDG domain-containing protein [Dysgonamonadaceae bacterium]